MPAFVHDLPECLVVREHRVVRQAGADPACRLRAMTDDAARLVQFLATVAVPSRRLWPDVTGVVLPRRWHAGITGPCEATTQVRESPVRITKKAIRSFICHFP